MCIRDSLQPSLEAAPPVPVPEEGLTPLGWGTSPAGSELPQGPSPLQAGSYFYGLSPAASRLASPTGGGSL
eukprot:3510943-Prorocentrum_lima.AAC.1